MNNDFTQTYGQIQELSKSTLESINRYHQLVSRGTEQLARQQLAAVGDYLQGGVKQIQAVGKAKGMQEMLASEVTLASELGEKWVDNARKCLEICLQTQGELMQLVSDTLGKVPSQAKKAA